MAKLRTSQWRCIEGMTGGPCYMVAADMGIGKTGAALTAARIELDRRAVAHVLILAPLLVAEETWPEEIEQWEHTCGLTYEVLTGPPDRREQRARRMPQISIINRENINWLIELWGEANWPYDMVIIDEMSSFKNSTKRNKPTKKAIEDRTDEILRSLPKGMSEKDQEKKLSSGLKKLQGHLTRFGGLCRVRKHIDVIVGLTGTISPNGLLDIWSQYYLLDQGERLGSSYSGYRTRYFDGDYMGYKYTMKEGAFDLIVKEVADITVSMRTEDFTDMPPVVHNTVKVRMPPAMMKKYKAFERSLVLEEHDIEAVNAGVLTGKLLQFANGSIYDEDGNDIYLHSLKLDALDLIIEEAAGAPVLVAYYFNFDLEALRKRYPKAEVIGEGKNVVKRWNDGQIPILLAHPQAAGHGLNLQYGGCISVWYGLVWSLEYYQQLNKRLHRPGQTKPVFIHHIITEGTMDEKVMAILPEKDATQEMFLDAFRWTDDSQPFRPPTPAPVAYDDLV